MTPQEFENWYEKPIRDMNAYEHGGLAVMMLCLPLLERFLREKSGCREGNLGPAFYAEFKSLFNNLSVDQVKDFWQVYRNGLLHQATFSEQSRNGTDMPRAWITEPNPEYPHEINYDALAKVFVCLPLQFSATVLAKIKADTGTFAAQNSPHHGLLGVQRAIYYSYSTTISSPLPPPPIVLSPHTGVVIT